MGGNRKSIVKKSRSTSTSRRTNGKRETRESSVDDMQIETENFKSDTEKLVEEIRGYIPFNERHVPFTGLLNNEEKELDETCNIDKDTEDNSASSENLDSYTEKIASHSRDIMDLYIDELNTLRSDPLYKGNENDIQTIITSCGLPILLKNINERTVVEDSIFFDSIKNENIKESIHYEEDQAKRPTIHQIVKQSR